MYVMHKFKYDFKVGPGNDQKNYDVIKFNKKARENHTKILWSSFPLRKRLKLLSQRL